MLKWSENKWYNSTMITRALSTHIMAMGGHFVAFCSTSSSIFCIPTTHLTTPTSRCQNQSILHTIHLILFLLNSSLTRLHLDSHCLDGFSRCYPSLSHFTLPYCHLHHENQVESEFLLWWQVWEHFQEGWFFFWRECSNRVEFDQNRATYIKIDITRTEPAYLPIIQLP